MSEVPISGEALSVSRPDEKPIRLMVAAPYATVRAGLRALVGHDPFIRIVGDAGGVGELSGLIDALRPDVVLLDDLLREWDGLVDILAEHETALMLVTDDRTEIDLLAASALPGWALLLRGADGLEMTAAIGAVHRGLIVVDRSFGPAIVPKPEASGAEGGTQNQAALEPLTARERDVLRLMAVGMANKQIAVRLGVTANTVKFHVASILAKLGAASRTEAVSIGLRTGQVPL
jgi:DNA-binding NarL/FixJ family response regulator